MPVRFKSRQKQSRVLDKLDSKKSEFQHIKVTRADDNETIVSYEPPTFDPGKDSKKVLAEYDRIVKHFEKVHKAYPQAWGRSLEAVKRDRAAYVEFAKAQKVKA